MQYEKLSLKDGDSVQDLLSKIYKAVNESNKDLPDKKFQFKFRIHPAAKQLSANAKLRIIVNISMICGTPHSKSFKSSSVIPTLSPLILISLKTY